MDSELRSFENNDAPMVKRDDVRSLSPEQAAALGAGEEHYRAYVGPPDRFDFMSATQFALMFQCGLRERHYVLDFGAGSLRAGRLLIPYLLPGRYHAIEPHSWLISDGVAAELGQDAIGLKQPRFSHNDDFDCGVFGRKFDFIIAQSIVTHCGPSLFQRLMNGFAISLEEAGLALFSYCNSPMPTEHLPSEEWIYPTCVTYTEAEVHEFVNAAGLVGRSIPWFHPGAKWFVAALSPEKLPSDREAALLNGAVLNDAQFAASRMRQDAIGRS